MLLKRPDHNTREEPSSERKLEEAHQREAPEEAEALVEEAPVAQEV